MVGQGFLRQADCAADWLPEHSRNMPRNLRKGNQLRLDGILRRKHPHGELTAIIPTPRASCHKKKKGGSDDSNDEFAASTPAASVIRIPLPPPDKAKADKQPEPEAAPQDAPGSYVLEH